MKAIPDETVQGRDWGKDKLGFEKYALSLASVITQSTPEFTIGILGEWGTGKTTLMKKIAYVLENPKINEGEKEVKEKHSKISAVPIWFNPWRYQHETHHAIIPVLETIRNQIRPYSELSKLMRVLKRTESILMGMSGTTLNLGIITIPIANTLNAIRGSRPLPQVETIYYGELAAVKSALDKINEKKRK
jgi:hypothetical protein